MLSLIVFLVHDLSSGKVFTLRKKSTIYQVATNVVTSKNVLFPGHSDLLATGTDNIVFPKTLYFFVCVIYEF